MSDDDNNERGKKDNTSPVHKPENAIDHTKAPSGHLGTNRLQGLTPGGSTPYPAAAQVSTFDKSEQQKQHEPQKDTRPQFEQTGDKDVDAFYSQDHNMVSKDEAQKKRAEELAKKFKKDKDQDKGLGL